MFVFPLFSLTNLADTKPIPEDTWRSGFVKYQNWGSRIYIGHGHFRYEFIYCLQLAVTQTEILVWPELSILKV